MLALTWVHNYFRCNVGTVNVLLTDMNAVHDGDGQVVSFH
jgi:hypothetical protein